MRHAVNGVLYEAEVLGDGFPLLLLHGFTGSKETWKTFYPSWRETCQIVSLDIIGHGESSSPSDVARYKTESFVQDLVLLLNELEIKKTNILGYSMGGRLALSFSVLLPDRVNKLILESASPGLKTEEERKERKQLDAALAKKIKENGIKWFVEKWEKTSLFASQENLPIPIKESLREQRLHNNPIGLANSLLGMGTGVQPSWWECLDTLNIPTMLVTGQFDKKFCQIAKEMEYLMPFAKNEVVLKAGHAIHLEQPEIFGKIVREFLFNT